MGDASVLIIPSGAGERGPEGPAGPKGEKGEKGEPGTNQVPNLEPFDTWHSGILRPYCHCATTVALPACTYAEGPPATLTANANGALGAIDGVTLIENQRVLVKNQANEIQNGIYRVSNPGGASAKWVLVRGLDMEKSSQIPGATTYVHNGTTQNNTLWAVAVLGLDPAGAFVLGTSKLFFRKVNAIHTGEIEPGQLQAKGGRVYAFRGEAEPGGTKIKPGEAVVMETTHELSGNPASNAYIVTITPEHPTAALSATVTSRSFFGVSPIIKFLLKNESAEEVEGFSILLNVMLQYT